MRLCHFAFIVLIFLTSELQATPAGSFELQNQQSTHVVGPEKGDAFFAPMLPRRILRADIASWSQRLTLSKEQRAFLESLYSVYLEEDAITRRELFTPVWDWAVALGSSGSPSTNIDLAMDVEAFFEAREDAILKVMQVEEERIFSPLIPVLTDEQLSVLPTVRRVRSRHLYRVVDTFLPSTKTTLHEILAVTSADKELAYTDEEAFSAVLSEYEDALTRLLRRLYSAKIKMLAEGPKHRLLGRDNTADQVKFERLLERSTSAETAIVTLNGLYLSLLCDLLVDESAARFRSEYNARAHPQVYPNPYRVDAIFDLARELAPDANSLEEIEALEDFASMRDKRIADRMIHEIQEWITGFTSSFTINISDRQRHFEQLDELTSQRRENAKEMISLIYSAVGEKDVPEVQVEVKAFWSRVDRYVSYDNGLLYFPVAPENRRTAK